MTTWRWLAVAVLMVTGVAWGDGFRKEDVAGTAKWAMFFDIQKFNKSQIGSLMTEQDANPQAKQAMDFIRMTLGVDVLKDLSSITLYGAEYGDKAAVGVVRGLLNAAAIEPLIKANAAYEEITYGSRVLHKWADKNNGRPGVVCFLTRDIAVVGADPERVKAAIDVLDGKADSLKTGGGLPGFDKVDEQILVVSARKGESGIGEKINTSMLKNADWMTLTFSETAGMVSLDLKLAATTPEAAAQMEQVVKGMIAFAVLQQDQSPALADAVKSISTVTENSVISMRMTHTAPAFHSFIKAMRQRPGGPAPAPTGGQDKAADVPQAGN